MLVEKSLTEFTQELASNSAAPGGGSTAALAGALGAALTARLFELGCIVRRETTRSVTLTDAGRELFEKLGA